MKNGTCTKCGLGDVYEISSEFAQRNHSNLSMLSHVKLVEYICCGCGLVETYLADMNDTKKIKDKFTKVETS
jgi:predicted nucleic-acid-binding Zn-ribbon protein